MKRRLRILAALAIVAAIAAGMVWYWRYSSLHPSTQDAYLQANVLDIAAQVTGTVAAVEVAEHQHVAAGDVLFRIDDRDYRLAVRQAQASVAEIAARQASYDSQTQAAEAAVSSARTAKETADAALERAKRLFADGTVSQASLDQATSAAAQAASTLQGALAQLAQAQAAQAANRAALAAAQAALEIARLNLERTVVRAPAAGWVANVELVKGAVVTAYAPLFALVESGAWWITANFKETDLARLRPGQPATITVDMLPGVTLSGKVQSIGPGSGSTFSLLPPENASGNWVKVTQRFPVRIALDAVRDDFRVGASSTVTVDTTAAGQ
ncbi:MAG: hemolysin D [Paracoccaceae bacterium]|nr:MAG: hemolysin D [Paracoccaceae bacterium]